ncbi:class I SAM-dependent methyltransferase [Alphaproteobacteria bacterium]|nr:class I SAM-dependent methyltransferase [Alphaproteobacteria bacterium]
MNCRHCKASLTETFLDLGFAPPSNAYLTAAELSKPEKRFPLRIMVCTICWLVQTEDYTEAGELFSSNYAYFSSTSSSWLAHAAGYAEKLTKMLELDENKLVIEVGSNDGYLLKNFLAAGVSCLGIEPTASTATVAEKLGIPVLREFFSELLGKRLASEGRQADLIVGNNVYAHVPDINDFTMGIKALLKPGGTVTLEFPHIKKLIEGKQFDTVYHEHFSYLSLYTVERIFRAAGLRIWDVEKLPTHGGSLRIYGCHIEDARMNANALEKLQKEEAQFGLQTLAIYQNFQIQADKIKNDLLSFLIEQKKSGKRVVAYGAAAKGNTLLNYAGIKNDLVPFICDAAIAKQGKYTPGTHIPIVPPSALSSSFWDFVLIFPWNIAREVMSENSELTANGTKFVIAIPEVRIL